MIFILTRTHYIANNEVTLAQIIKYLSESTLLVCQMRYYPSVTATLRNLIIHQATKVYAESKQLYVE